MYISEKQQNGKVLSKSLVETAANDWADLGNAHEMGEEIYATYHREMEATWGPDHITTVPEDYAQHIILGVHNSSLNSGRLPILHPLFVKILPLMHKIFSYRLFVSFGW